MTSRRLLRNPSFCQVPRVYQAPLHRSFLAPPGANWSLLAPRGANTQLPLVRQGEAQVGTGGDAARAEGAVHLHGRAETSEDAAMELDAEGSEGEPVAETREGGRGLRAAREGLDAEDLGDEPEALREAPRELGAELEGPRERVREAGRAEPVARVDLKIVRERPTRVQYYRVMKVLFLFLKAWFAAIRQTDTEKIR